MKKNKITPIFEGRGYTVYKETMPHFRVVLEFGGNHLIVNFKIDITDLFLFLSKQLNKDL